MLSYRKNIIKFLLSKPHLKQLNNIFLILFYYLIGVAFKFARAYKIARVHRIVLVYISTKTLLHEQTVLHGDSFAQVEFYLCFYFLIPLTLTLGQYFFFNKLSSSFFFLFLLSCKNVTRAKLTLGAKLASHNFGFVQKYLRGILTRSY